MIIGKSAKDVVILLAKISVLRKVGGFYVSLVTGSEYGEVPIHVRL